MVTPDHLARPPRRREERRGRRHRRYHREEAARGARRERSAGFHDSVKAPSPSPTKKPRLRLEVGEVRGCAWRFEHFNPEIAVAVPDGVVPASSSSSHAAPRGNCDGLVVYAPEAATAPATGGAGTAPSSSPAAPPPTTKEPFSACQVSVVPAPSPPSSQVVPQALLFTAAARARPAPPPKPASALCPSKRKAIPASQQPANANPANAVFPTLASPPQDVFERAKLLQDRFADLIARKQQELDDHFRENLRRRRAPPEAPKVAVDKETLRRMAARDRERKRSRQKMGEQERNAKRATLLVQMARPEHLRALGIDAAMERVVSPERTRDGNGAPVLSPEHPCSPLEKLGLFLKAE